MNKYIFTISCAFALTLVSAKAQDIPNPSHEMGNSPTIENIDAIKVSKEKNDKLIETYLLLPLEEPYDRNKVIKFDRWLETVPEAQQSEDFKATVKNYSSFLKNYEKYTAELQELALRFYHIVENNSMETTNIKVGRANGALRGFKNGKVKAVGSSKDNTVYMPYSYFSIYKNSATNPSIYYLDDRIEELNKAMESYIAFAENPTKGIGSNEAETLETLLSIASKLSPVPKARQVNFRPTIANTVVDPDKVVTSSDSKVSQEEEVEKDNEVSQEESFDTSESITRNRTIKDIREEIKEIKKKREIIKKTRSSYKDQYNKEKDKTLEDLIKDEEKKLVELDGKLNELYNEYESLMGEVHPDVSKNKK